VVVFVLPNAPHNATELAVNQHLLNLSFPLVIPNMVTSLPYAVSAGTVALPNVHRGAAFHVVNHFLGT